MAFFEGWSWFKFKNLGLALATNLKFCTSVAKGLKPKVRKRWGPNPTFLRSCGGKTGGAEQRIKIKSERYFLVCTVYHTRTFSFRYSYLQSSQQLSKIGLIAIPQMMQMFQ